MILNLHLNCFSFEIELSRIHFSIYLLTKKVQNSQPVVCSSSLKLSGTDKVGLDVVYFFSIHLSLLTLYMLIIHFYVDEYIFAMLTCTDTPSYVRKLYPATIKNPHEYQSVSAVISCLSIEEFYRWLWLQKLNNLRGRCIMN